MKQTRSRYKSEGKVETTQQPFVKISRGTFEVEEAPIQSNLTAWEEN